MKQLLLHGPAKTASRAKLIQLKSEFDADSISTFDESVGNSVIIAAWQTGSMFGEERTIILENPDLELDVTPAFDLVNLLVWIDKDASKSAIYKSFLNSQKTVMFFPETQEVTVFPWLDLLGNRDKRAFVEIEKLKKNGFDIYYFLTMAFYLLRNLTVMPSKLSAFQREKLKKQRTKFGPDELVKIYQALLELEYKLKSGLIEKSQAEFVLVNQFME